MDEFLKRFEIMIGEDALNNLKTKKVIIFGTGGVGGYVAEFLVRSGITKLTVVDFDRVDITNLNRQIIALNSTLGQLKVDVIGDRLKDINPNLEITKINKKLAEENILEFNLNDYDFVVDCIDDIKAKQSLIKYCYNNGIKIIVSCGAGNRYKNLPQFELADIKKTSYDAIAKILRKFCVSQNIKKLMVVYTKEKPLKPVSGKIGSVAYYPASMACVISSYVINSLFLPS